MQTDLIIINDYCTRCDIEPDFVRMLGEGGLIDVEMIDDTDCFPASQLGELERYTLQERVRKLENELHFYR